MAINCGLEGTAGPQGQGRRARRPLFPSMALPTQRHHHRPQLSPHPSRLHHILVPGRSIHPARRSSTSFCCLPPTASPSPLPKKRADHEAAADFGEVDAAVVDKTTEAEEQREYGGREYVSTVGAGLPALLRAGRARSGGDPMFFLLTAAAVSTSVAFLGMVAAAIPTMLAMRRAANSFATLADAAVEELPSAMAAVRLSGMEISDLTLELTNLSCEIADGVNTSAKVAKAVETGIGQMQDIARQQAICKRSLFSFTVFLFMLGNVIHMRSNGQRTSRLADYPHSRTR